jgi:hypothetical protein
MRRMSWVERHRRREEVQQLDLGTGGGWVRPRVASIDLEREACTT